MDKNKIVDSILEYSRDISDTNKVIRTMEAQTHEILSQIYEYNVHGPVEVKYECVEAELYYLRLILDKMTLRLNEINDIIDDYKNFWDSDE